MVPSEVVFGALASVGLLILLAFVVVFMRLERAPKRQRPRISKPSR